MGVRGRLSRALLCLAGCGVLACAVRCEQNESAAATEWYAGYWGWPDRDFPDKDEVRIGFRPVGGNVQFIIRWFDGGAEFSNATVECVQEDCVIASDGEALLRFRRIDRNHLRVDYVWTHEADAQSHVGATYHKLACPLDEHFSAGVPWCDRLAEP